MKEKKQIIVICLSSLIWSFGSYVNVVILFYIPEQFKISEFYSSIIISMLGVATFIGTILYLKVSKKLSPLKNFKYSSFIGAGVYLIAALNYTNFCIVIPATILGYGAVSNLRLLNKKFLSLSSDGELRRKAFSYNFALVNLGALFAGIGAVFLYQSNITNMRYIYLINAISLILSYALVSFNIKEQKYNEVSLASDKNKSKKSLFNNISLKMLIAIGGLYFGIFQLNFLIPKNIEFHYPIYIYSLMIAVNTIFCVLLSPFLIKILMRFSEYFALQLSGVFLIIGLILFNFINIYMVIIATIFFTIGEVLVITNIDAYLLTFFEDEKYDKALVLVRTFSQVSKIIAPIIAGYLVTYFTFYIAFLVVIILLVFANFLLYSFHKNKVKKTIT